MGILLALAVLLVAWTPAQAQFSDIRTWIIPYASPAAIQAGLDLPNVLSNDFASTVNVRSVACFAKGGTVTLNPILTGRATNSILRQPVVCQPDVWTPGQLNGTPVLRPFGTNGATCTTQPCTIDLNLESHTGAPTYLIVKVVVRRP